MACAAKSTTVCAQLLAVLYCMLLASSQELKLPGSTLRGCSRRLLVKHVEKDSSIGSSSAEVATPSPPIPPAPPPSGNDNAPIGGCTDVPQLLALTTNLRSKHHAGPLHWDDSLAASSLTHARSLAAAGCQQQHSAREGYGETVMVVRSYAPPAATCSDAVRGWYYQSTQYNFATKRPYSSNPGPEVDAFTQLVWRGTTAIGCGVAQGRARTPGSAAQALDCKVVVCRFTKPGNVPSDQAFAANVLPP